MKFSRRSGKNVSSKRGILLIESAMSLSILTILGLVLLKLSLSALQPRQWTIMQTLTDAYMDREQAWAQRIPFDMIVNSALAPVGQPIWPISPASQVLNGANSAIIGRLPNQIGGAAGNIIRADVVRTSRLLPTAIAGNPAGMQVYQLQSVMTYTVVNQPGSSYVKSRTVIRSE